MVTPKGILLPIGGSENKDCHDKGDCSISFYNNGVLQRLLKEMKGDKPRLEIVPTASGIPEIVSRRYIQAFNKLGCDNVGILPVESREDALQEAYVDRVRQADGIFFTGGDQSRLSRFFSNTPFIDLVYQRYLRDDFIISGTSAGAMAMSSPMITGSSPSNRHDVNMGTGLSFIDNVIIDTHFVERDRYSRLAKAVACNPGYIGIGLGEDAGIVVTEGTDIEVIGSGQVVIMDNQAHSHPQMLATPTSLGDLPMQMLEMNDTYNLSLIPYALSNDILVS